MMHLFAFKRRAQLAPPSDGRWLHELNRRAANLKDGEVVADLSEVRNISSRELGELVKIHLRLRQDDRRLVLENVQSFVMDIFELTRINRLVEVRTTHSV